MLRRLLAGVMCTSWLCGCGGDNSLNCESSERYSGASSVTPVRVPDDLSPPDETDSLRLPPPPLDATPRESASTTATPRGCLESPPDYFEEGRPGAQPAGRNEDPERALSN
jgi:hypothetical protein